MKDIDQVHIAEKAEMFFWEAKSLLDRGKSLAACIRALKLYKKISDSEKIIDCYLLISEIYFKTNKLNLAVKNLKSGLKENEKIKNLKRKIELLNKIGNSYLNSGYYKKSLAYYQAGLKVCKEYGQDQKLLSSLLMNYGSSLQMNGNLVDSLKNYLSAYKIKLSLDDKPGIANILNNIGMIYQKQENHKMAISYLNKGLIIRKELGNRVAIAASYSNLASSFRHLEKYDEAEKCYLSSLEIKEQLGINTGQQNLGLGKINIEKHNYEAAECFLNKALKLANKHEDRIVLVQVYEALGVINIYKHQTDLANEFLQKSLALAQQSGFLQHEMSVIYNLYYFYEVKKEFEKALEYYKLYDELHLKFLNENSQRKIQDLQHKFESDKKKKEVALAKSKAELLRLKTVELEKDKAEAELISLQSRINPHFLFNSLNTIMSLVRTSPEDAETVAENLSELLRYTLLVAKRKLVLLSEEFELIGQYLLIEKVRFGSRLNYQIDLPQKLSAVKIPPLLIQPLAENAIKYSIAPALNGGTLKISAKSVNKFIELTISSTLSKQSVSKINLGTGFGLEYVKKRLELAYKKKNLLKVRVKDLFEVIIKIPNFNSESEKYEL